MKIIAQRQGNRVYKSVLFKRRGPKLLKYVELYNGIYCYSLIDSKYHVFVSKRCYEKKQHKSIKEIELEG